MGPCTVDRGVAGEEESAASHLYPRASIPSRTRDEVREAIDAKFAVVDRGGRYKCDWCTRGRSVDEPTATLEAEQA